MTGVTILDSSVEEIRPPMSTRDNGEISGLLLKAIGVNPPIAVKLVRMIGKKRSSPATLIASSRVFPCSRN